MLEVEGRMCVLEEKVWTSLLVYYGQFLTVPTISAQCAKDRTFWVIEDRVAPTSPFLRGEGACPGLSATSRGPSRPGGRER